MKTTKTEFKFFTVMDWKEEEEYLRWMHNEGWKFTNVSFIGSYHFQKCEPEDVIYQLDYNQDGRQHKTQYVQMFRDCGWEYIQDFFGYSYFRKKASEMNDREEIFCDDESRLEMMMRVFTGRMIPLLAIFFLLLIPNIILQIRTGCVPNYVVAGVWGFVLVLYISVFVKFTKMYFKFKKSLGK